MRTFKEGQIVTLAEFRDGDTVHPEQRAEVMDVEVVNDTVLVRLLEFDGYGDDGIREVPVDRIVNNMTFWDALKIALDDVDDTVYQRGTPLEGLTYVVKLVTPAELSTLEPNVREAYRIVREHHDVEDA